MPLCHGIDIDSLEQKLNATKNRKKKVEILNQYNAMYKREDPRFIFDHFHMALKLAMEIKFQDGIASAHGNLANYFLRNNLVDSSLFHFNKALKIYQQRTDDLKTGITLFNIGSVYFSSSNYVEAFEHTNNALNYFTIVGDIPNIASAHSLLCDILFASGFDTDAIEHCLTALNLYTEIESLEGQSRLLNSIGRINLNLGELDKSIRYFNQAYYIAEQDNNPKMLATSLRNLGHYYIQTNKYDRALDCFTNSLHIVQTNPDVEKLGYIYLDIGITHTFIGEFEVALENLQKALLHADSSLNMELRARVYSELGNLYSATEKYDIAIVFLKQSLFVAQKINADPILQQCYKSLANFYDKQNDIENAFKYYKLYTAHKDTLFSNQSAMQIAEAEALYDLSQKDKQIEFLKNENKLREMETAEKNLINIWLISVLIFVFILTLVLYRQYRVQNKVNQALSEQKDAINEQKLEIELQKENIEKANDILAEKNKQIIDSLEYAKRIQYSLLPDGNLLKKKFSDSFIWYLPRDIVGGDFYWYSENRNSICIVVMDCSGHGVPGAFMTVLANTLLNRRANEMKRADTPNHILTYLDKNVRKELNQQGIQLSAFEGIDLGVCIIDTRTLRLKFSGAKLPLYYYADGVLNQISGNRQSIGGGNGISNKFDVTTLKLNIGDKIYLATDGFQDQFGGDKEKKFMKMQFKNLLHSIADKPMEEQNEKLQSVFHKWKDFNIQTDDILIVGIKV
jgi:serine phosphatase RsbU (regulator of sigma subunit)